MNNSTKDDLFRSGDRVKIQNDLGHLDERPKYSTENDAIEEALATAEAVVAKTHSEILQEIPPDGELSASLSLKQVIENAENRLEYRADGSDLEKTGLPEMLDALDIKAELGRPDEITEPSYISELQKDRTETYEFDHSAVDN